MIASTPCEIRVWISAICPATSVLRFWRTTSSTLPRARASALMAQIICSRQALPTSVFDTPRVNISSPTAAVVVVSPAAVVSAPSPSLQAPATSASTKSSKTATRRSVFHFLILSSPPSVRGRRAAVSSSSPASRAGFRAKRAVAASKLSSIASFVRTDERRVDRLRIEDMVDNQRCGADDARPVTKRAGGDPEFVGAERG